MVDGTSTELAVEFLGPESPEVMNCVGPQMEHVVPGEGVPLFNHHHLAAQQTQLNGCPQSTWTPTDDQTLRSVTEKTLMRWEEIKDEVFFIFDCSKGI